MSTQCIVAVPDGDGFRGRYVHCDGYPSATGRFLRELVNRDGLSTVVQTIVMNHPAGWSAINPTCTEAGNQSGVMLVPGYGVAYEGEPDRHEWLSATNDRGIEWAYVLTRGGIVVWQNAESWRKRWDIDLRLTDEQLDNLSDREPIRLFWWWCVARFWYWSGRMR